MLQTKETKEKAKVMLTQYLSGLSVTDTLLVLNTATALILNESDQHEDQDMKKPFISSQANFLPRHAGRSCSVESDPELQQYIHSIHERRTIKQITEMCRVKFGDKRGPSKSSIHRYIQKMTELAQQENKSHE